LLVLFWILVSEQAFGVGTSDERERSAAATAPTEPPKPAFVSETKRLTGANLAKKREGVFATALPFVSADPLNGFGGGASGYVYFNGGRDDPLFAFTPYRARLGVTGNLTTGASHELKLKLDVPFLAETPWRLQVDLKYGASPNNLYFGLTEATLAPLPGGTYAAYSDALATTRPGVGEEAIVVADVLRHKFLEREWMLNLKAEHLLFGGNWRLLVGYELQHLSYETYEGREVDANDSSTGGQRNVPNGRSLLRDDAAAGRVFGVGGGVVSLLQLSLMYDTRDFEPDPTKGVFVELANEFSSPWIGSEFSFNKVLFQLKAFFPLLPEHLPRTVLAIRFGYGTILGDEAPCFEFQDQWTTEGSVNALGGAQTLRGYKANRFLGRTVAFANLELRHQFVEFDAMGQNFSFAATPFVDAGTIGDAPFALRLEGTRASAGVGLRIGWNRSTVVSLDLAASPEDLQFFVGFNSSY